MRMKFKEVFAVVGIAPPPGPCLGNGLSSLGGSFLKKLFEFKESIDILGFADQLALYGLLPIARLWF